MPQPSEKKRYSVQILEKKQLTKDVVELRVTRPDSFTYAAGQFVQFVVPDGEKEILRSYSLSSAPADEYLEFCIKILPDGKASTMLSQKTVGDEITIIGPSGHFVIKEQPSSLTFLATGVGLAPIMGILHDEIRNKKTDCAIRLLFGVRHESDTFWQERLDELQHHTDSFSYDICLSQPDSSWDGATGHITQHLDNASVESEFFLCGGMPMIKEARTVLMQKGVEPKNIHFEIF